MTARITDEEHATVEAIAMLAGYLEQVQRTPHAFLVERYMLFPVDMVDTSADGARTSRGWKINRETHEGALIALHRGRTWGTLERAALDLFAAKLEHDLRSAWEAVSLRTG